MRTIEDRFWRKVDAEGDCWEWVAGTDSDGYGRFWVNGHGRKAHRVAYEMLVEPIPDGLTVDHLCRVRRCVNPDHMEVVTGRENTLRSPHRVQAPQRAVTSCLRGHTYDEANTYVDPDGHRNCRTCDRDRKRLQRAQISDSAPA